MAMNDMAPLPKIGENIMTDTPPSTLPHFTSAKAGLENWEPIFLNQFDATITGSKGSVWDDDSWRNYFQDNIRSITEDWGNKQITMELEDNAPINIYWKVRRWLDSLDKNGGSFHIKELTVGLFQKNGKLFTIVTFKNLNVLKDSAGWNLFANLECDPMYSLDYSKGAAIARTKIVFTYESAHIEILDPTIPMPSK